MIEEVRGEMMKNNRRSKGEMMKNNRRSKGGNDDE